MTRPRADGRSGGEGAAEVPSFVAGLREHTGRVAVRTASATLTYGELADRVDTVAAGLRGERRLVAVAMRATSSALAGYLAALAAGHVVLAMPGTDAADTATLLEAWDPDVVLDADGVIEVRRSRSRHVLHPELTLLMATSGSTGSPRLVRLGRASLEANANAIAASLGLTADDRAALTLPLHYCYGLSIVHSSLTVGAGLLLAGHSVVDPEFWVAFRDLGGTCLHGVPHTFAQLDRVGFLEKDLPDLRLVTQAGGRLAPDAVRRWVRTGQERGWRFVVMYGQTEATARMSYLPSHLADGAPDAVGVPVPGGRIDVADPDADGVGELVYRGPNVMLGYADVAADLALGRCTDALRTGDLGRLGADGLVRVVGRRARITKPFGVRVDLDGVERLLADHGIIAAAVAREDEDGGIDAGVVAAVETPDDDGLVVARARALLVERLPLPPHAVAVHPVSALPRLANDKVDHRAVAASAVAPASVDHRAERRSPFARRRSSDTVRTVFERAFPGRVLRDDASFVDLGGDSLTFVAVSVELEAVLGHLPSQWDRLPLAELEVTRHGSPTRGATVETAAVLRALAIVLVVGEHVHLWSLLGGAHLLLALAGWSLARFTLSPPEPGSPRALAPSPAPRLLRSAARIAVPASLWIAFRSCTQDDVRWTDALLGGSLFHPLVQGYWFVDALVQILLGLAGLLAVPLVWRVERAHPVAFPAVLLGAAHVLLLLPGADPGVVPDLYSTHRVVWLVVLGWLVQRADTPVRRVGVAAVAVADVAMFFGADHGRALVVVVGVLVLLGRPRSVLPRSLARPVGAVASASLAIYLTHFALLPLLGHGVPPLVLAVTSVAVGIGAERMRDCVVREAARRFSGASNRSATGRGAPAAPAWPAGRAGRRPGRRAATASSPRRRTGARRAPRSGSPPVARR